LDTAGLAAATPEASAMLQSRAVVLARAQRVDYLELRQSDRLKGEFRVDTHKVSLTRPLELTVEELWDSLPSERRNRVRKARKAGLTALSGGNDLLPRFYRVWSNNMRDLGSPVHSRRFFETVLEVFRDSVHVLLIRYSDQDIGAAIVIEFKGTLAVPWVSSLRAHFALHPNDLLYWEAMKLAQERGHRRFDFGRSTERSGNYDYKVRWGAQSTPIYWHYQALGRKQPVLASEDRDRYGLALQVWRRMPLAFTNWLGPKLRKQITS
jgi:FemAB-related protein (PEP-CTERM system-associated)